MASQKEKTKFFNNIDKLVEAYKDVKSKSLVYIKDYGEEDLKAELLQSLYTFVGLGNEMIRFVSPVQVDEQEVQNAVASVISLEDLGPPAGDNLIVVPEDESEDEEEFDDEEEEIEVVEEEIEDSEDDENDEEWEESESDGVEAAIRLLRERLDASVFRKMVSAQNDVVSSHSAKLRSSLEKEEQERSTDIISGMKDTVDMLVAMWADET